MKLILGLGKTGLSIARFLQRQRINYKIADSQFTGAIQAFNLDVEPILGAWQIALLNAVDEIFISPGIAQNETIVLWAREKSIPITSDIELFGRFAKVPIIGITGSNGKSTVTQLLGEMIKNTGKKVAVGGNIGKPALDCLDDDIDYYVLELSSYQLDYTQKLSLITGVVLNITPDHLDRYNNFEDYKNSKLSLYAYCQKPVFNLMQAHTPNGIGFSIDIPKQVHNFGTVTCHGSCFLLKGDKVLMDVNEIQLIGKHNISNMLCALALGEQIELNIDSMITTIKAFKGLEHRLEWVGNKAGVDYYNDSKATNATATITAINALKDKYDNISLIIGGIKKDEDYAELFSLINACITNVILIGQSAQELSFGISINIQFADTMKTAITLSKNTHPQAILLSPACASFDMFNDFEHRGNTFKQHLNGLG